MPRKCCVGGCKSKYDSKEIYAKVHIAVFVKTVTMLWNCINFKSKNAWFLLNDENRKPFESVDDERFESILQLAENINDMDVSKSRYSGRVMYLTADTNKALHLTLHDLVSLIKLLLAKGFSYVLPGNFQNDKLEGEFGIYRQSAGGCYYISLPQLMNSLSIQYLKLFNKLDIESIDNHVKEECYTAGLTEGEIFMLDEACLIKEHIVRSRRKLVIFYIGLCCIQRYSTQGYR